MKYISQDTKASNMYFTSIFVSTHVYAFTGEIMQVLCLPFDTFREKSSLNCYISIVYSSGQPQISYQVTYYVISYYYYFLTVWEPVLPVLALQKLPREKPGLNSLFFAYQKQISIVFWDDFWFISPKISLGEKGSKRIQQSKTY